MFFGIMVFVNLQYGFTNLIFFTYGMALMCFILYQGTYYWWVKYSVLKNETVFQQTVLSRFRKFKTQNQVAIALIPLLLGLQWVLSGNQINSKNLIGWAIFVNLFAVCEYINYYHKQLMYDNRNDLNYLLKNKKLKEASLFKDLRENKI